MFVSDTFVFLHLQKAAGTYAVDRLSQALPGEVQGGHAPLVEGAGGRVVAAAIRDPWDWYVSLWSYGCMGEGELRDRLVQPHGQMRMRALRGVLRGREKPRQALARIRCDRSRDPQTWAALYASAEDPTLFRTWLRGLLTMPGAGHLPDTYPALPMCGQVGFMTFRVLKLFTDWAQAIARGQRPKSTRTYFPSWSRLMRMLSCYGPQASYTLPRDLYLGKHQARNEAVYAAVRVAPDGYMLVQDGDVSAIDVHAVSSSDPL